MKLILLFVMVESFNQMIENDNFIRSIVFKCFLLRVLVKLTRGKDNWIFYFDLKCIVTFYDICDFICLCSCQTGVH